MNKEITELEEKIKELRDKHISVQVNNNWQELWCIPEGWVFSFFDEMLTELDGILQKSQMPIENYRVQQMKEKYGELRWYAGYPQDVEDEYEAWEEKWCIISRHTCYHCGKQAIGTTVGWIEPICKDHMNKEEEFCKYTKEEIEELNKYNYTWKEVN